MVIKGNRKGQVQVTPAEIVEELTKEVDAAECLQYLIKFLQAKKIIKHEIKNEENNSWSYFTYLLANS
ncbi:hypothetical protein MTR_2g076830 [Medicago truncatula]|uniref:AAA+ ATPase At3g28540-like C-terminal domain-containing protein n=1 Tax=Medicago truncatula TaxID=3880 RepID=G7IH84_MEDTR|nr:hypothetical protein MTR_2g076830 [Medicago truncatula]